MSYIEFSTQRADYLLELVNRIYPRRSINRFDGIDALVIERGFHPLTEVNYGPLDGVQEVIDYCGKKRIPVFSVDPDVTIFGIFRGSFSIYYLTLPVWPLMIYYGFSKGEISKAGEVILSNYLFVLQDPIVAGRNAVSARKIEEFVVNRLIEIRKIARPKIGIVYMGGHVGIKSDLQSKRRRDFTITNFEHFNFRRFSGLELGTLEMVIEANFDGNKWNFQEHRPKLFK